MQNHEKNTYSLCHIVIAVLAVVLMGLIVWMMVIVSHMQGTARVVNYAGLVRGTTQRMVKLEMAGEPQDEMRREIEAYIQGLREGDASLSLVRLSDPDFQAKMKELSGYYLQVKQEIIQLRRTRGMYTSVVLRPLFGRRYRRSISSAVLAGMNS